MRSSPEVKVRISAVAGRNCTGAPSGPCSSQSGAVAVGLGSARSCTDVSRVCARLEGFKFESWVSNGRFRKVEDHETTNLIHSSICCSPCKRGNAPGPKKTSGNLEATPPTWRSSTACDRATGVESTTRPSTSYVHKVRPSQSPHSPASSCDIWVLEIPRR